MSFANKLWCLVPNYACALCYAIFSFWGVLTLLVIGLGLNAGYRKIDLDEIESDELDHVAVQSYIAGAIYLACMLGCGARWLFLHLKEKNLQQAKLLRHIDNGEDV